MRHVHSDIPAVEFARPLNAETQNTFAVLASGSAIYVYGMFPQNEALMEFLRRRAPPQDVSCFELRPGGGVWGGGGGRGKIAESTVFLCQRFHSCQINNQRVKFAKIVSWQRLREACSLFFPLKCHRVVRERGGFLLLLENLVE